MQAALSGTPKLITFLDSDEGREMDFDTAKAWIVTQYPDMHDDDAIMAYFEAAWLKAGGKGMKKNTVFVFARYFKGEVVDGEWIPPPRLVV